MPSAPPKSIVRAAFVAASVLFCISTKLIASDRIVADCVPASSLTVIVPISFQDDPGTLLGRDLAPGSRISALAFRLRADDEQVIESIRIERAGAFAALEPRFEVAPVNSYIATFREEDMARASGPDDRVHFANAVIRLRHIPTTAIPLRFDPLVTTLANDGGTAEESAMTGTLELIEGCIGSTAPRSERQRVQRP